MIINTKDFISHTVKSIKEDKNTLHIKWFYKDNILPKQIVFDENFAWYLGLRQGDKAEKNKGTIGIVNTNEVIIKEVYNIYTKKFSMPLDKIKVYLMYSNKKSLNKSLRFIKQLKISNKNIKVIYKKQSKKVVMVIYSYNIVLNRIFSWCQNNIKSILKKLPLSMSYAYHAGYFDAEGHPDKTSNCFNWRTTNYNHALLQQRLLQNRGFDSSIQKEWEKHLNKHSYKIVIGNKKEIRKKDFKLFKNFIPFMIHSERTKECKELLGGNRIRKIDLEKYLPILTKNFNSSFTRQKFCNLSNLSKPSACRILKAFKNKNLIKVKEGKRIIKNYKFAGQEPNIYKLNFSEIN